MISKAPVEEKLWRTALDAFRRNIHQLGPWILGLAAIMVVADFYSVQDQIQQFQDIMDKVAAQLDNPEKAFSMDDSDTSPDFSLARAIGMLVQCIGYYGFTVVYLQREPITVAPVLGFKSFFHWGGQILLSALIVIGIGLGVVVVGGGLAFAINYAMHQEAPLPIILASVAAVVALIYAGVRLTLVGPLALSRIDAPLKSSWNLSRNNWWRMFWHYLMAVSIIWMVLFAALLIPTLALCFLTPMTAQSPLFVGGLAVMLSLSKSIVLAGGSVYFCVICRKLIQEQGLPGLRESGSISRTL